MIREPERAEPFSAPGQSRGRIGEWPFRGTLDEATATSWFRNLPCVLAGKQLGTSRRIMPVPFARVLRQAAKCGDAIESAFEFAALNVYRSEGQRMDFPPGALAGKERLEIMSQNVICSAFS